MILYRARSITSRPARLPAYEGNDPSVRMRGRWFTSSREDAVAFGAATFAPRSWELISVDVPNSIVDSFRVATTPHTVCGLSPIDHADKPESEYILQAFRVTSAEIVPMEARFRVRDYILVDKPGDALIQSANDLGVPVEELQRLAA